VPMPVVIKTREYGSAESYQDFIPEKQVEKDIEDLWG
jgi:hypothetical protein